MRPADVTIGLLADHPDAVPLLQAWFEREWASHYGPSGPGNAGEDLRNACNRNTLPIALVAICEGRVCGTAALKSESISTHRHLSPWLAALLVAPPQRHRGIATQLVAAVEETAARLGFTRLYAGTRPGPGTSESLLRRREWSFVERRPYAFSQICVFRKSLT